MQEKVIAVGVVLADQKRRVAEEHLDELEKLIETAGGLLVAKILAKRPAPDAATWIGSGKAEEIKRLAEKNRVSLVVFDDDLSPAQTRFTAVLRMSIRSFLMTSFPPRKVATSKKFLAAKCWIARR